MSNIVDYLKWRGDLTFDKDPINDIDNLIFSRISYLPFEKIQFQDKSKFIEFADQFKTLANEDFYQIDDLDLIAELAKSARFKNLIFSDYFEKLDLVEEKQFAAITVTLPNN